MIEPMHLDLLHESQMLVSSSLFHSNCCAQTSSQFSSKCESQFFHKIIEPVPCKSRGSHTRALEKMKEKKSRKSGVANGNS